jgi:3-methyladenine DNA glycosylase/8-oxoguanine DNA glycosylase
MQTLTPPPDFRYRPTILSHGWLVLSPFEYDETTLAVTRVDPLRDGEIVRWSMRADESETLHIEADIEPTPAQADELKALAARCLMFDLDLEPLYTLLKSHSSYAWVERVGAGRMLVSPTVWEDLAKTLMTTNTTWKMTRGMVERLAELGESRSDGLRTFPTPAQIAAYTPETLNEHVRAGYRGAYLREIATVIANGEFDAESLRDPDLSGAEVYQRLRSLKGYGAYAAGAMMRLLGKYDALGLDSVCRTMFKDLHNKGEPATDKQISAFYEPFGKWQGLVVWLDVIRDDYE